MIITLAIIAWVIFGTITFRRTGHRAIENVAGRNDWRRKNRVLASANHSSTCHKNIRYPNLSKDPRYHCNCWMSDDTYVFLPWTFVYTQVLWPIFVTVWGITNLSKLYSLKVGKDIKFFVPASYVKTQDELLADSEERRKELEKKIEELEADTL